MRLSIWGWCLKGSQAATLLLIYFSHAFVIRSSRMFSQVSRATALFYLLKESVPPTEFSTPYWGHITEGQVKPFSGTFFHHLCSKERRNTASEHPSPCPRQNWTSPEMRHHFSQFREERPVTKAMGTQHVIPSIRAALDLNLVSKAEI